MKIIIISRFCLLLALAGIAMVTHAQEEARWEIGAGAASLNLSHYRGADQRHSYLLPLPYLIYHGELIHADREGVRGILFERENVQLNLSINGTLPVRSGNNTARAGMESLQPTVQIGPNLVIALWQSENNVSRVEFRLPLRGSMTVSSSPRHVGWLIEPTMALARKNIYGWHAGLAAAASYADTNYHAHFYSVGAADATTARPAYQAPAGYSGAHLTWTMTKRFPEYWLGTFVRYDTLAGAAIAGSPLVKQRQNWSAGIAFARILGRSQTRVPIND